MWYSGTFFILVLVDISWYRSSFWYPHSHLLITNLRQYSLNFFFFHCITSLILMCILDQYSVSSFLRKCDWTKILADEKWPGQKYARPKKLDWVSLDYIFWTIYQWKKSRGTEILPASYCFNHFHLKKIHFKILRKLLYRERKPNICNQGVCQSRSIPKVG